MIFAIARGFFWVLGILFFVGMLGSALVVVLTSIEDMKELREKKEDEPLSKLTHDQHFVEPVPSAGSSTRGR